MTSITSKQRSLVLFLSASSYIAWFSGLDERIDAQSIVESPPPILFITKRNEAPRVDSVIRRDPFASSSFHADSALASSGRVNLAKALDLKRSPTDHDMDVPDIDVDEPDGISDSQETTTIPILNVKATLTGASPVAYVTNGTNMDIVRIGDLLAGRRIASIDLRGIVFADGTRLDLMPNSETRTTPRTSTSGVIRRLDELRKLLLGRQGHPTELGTAENAEHAIALKPAHTVTFPSPGPLPTVDQRGFSVGTNPTFDPTAPTPYPEAYPYAPPVRHP